MQERLLRMVRGQITDKNGLPITGSPVSLKNLKFSNIFQYLCLIDFQEFRTRNRAREVTKVVPNAPLFSKFLSLKISAYKELFLKILPLSPFDQYIFGLYLLQLIKIISFFDKIQEARQKWRKTVLNTMNEQQNVPPLQHSESVEGQDFHLLRF